MYPYFSFPSSQALSWCFYQLCMNPAVQEAARNEVVAVRDAYWKAQRDQGKAGERGGGGRRAVVWCGVTGAVYLCNFLLLSCVVSPEDASTFPFKMLQEMKYIEAVCMEVRVGVAARPSGVALLLLTFSRLA